MAMSTCINTHCTVCYVLTLSNAGFVSPMAIAQSRLCLRGSEKSKSMWTPAGDLNSFHINNSRGGVSGPTLQSNPQDPQFSASIHLLAAILLDMVFCLPIFPRRGRDGPQRGACGATAPRLTHPRIMDTGRQRLWSPSEAVVTTSLLSKRRELQHTKLRCTVEFPPGFNHSSPNTRRNQNARSYANYGW
jgi:hypothetical protein